MPMPIAIDVPRDSTPSRIPNAAQTADDVARERPQRVHDEHEGNQRLPVFGPRETPDEWLATLADVPMLRQPGEAWLYNTCSDIQGVLVARVSGQPLPEFLAERLFEPLGMADTGFEVPAGKLDRFTSY